VVYFYGIFVKRNFLNISQLPSMKYWIKERVMAKFIVLTRKSAKVHYVLIILPNGNNSFKVGYLPYFLNNYLIKVKQKVNLKKRRNHEI
jgi:hypothetical protein